MANEANKPASEQAAVVPSAPVDVKAVATEVAALLKNEYLAKQREDEARVAAHVAEVEQHKTRAEQLFAGLLAASAVLHEIEQLPDVIADHRGHIARDGMAAIHAVLGS